VLLLTVKTVFEDNVITTYTKNWKSTKIRQACHDKLTEALN